MSLQRVLWHEQLCLRAAAVNHLLKKTGVLFFMMLLMSTNPCAFSIQIFANSESILSTAIANTYYLDATNGNDSNQGISEATAWKTIAKVNASNFNPGDQVLFKRGETWRSTVLTIPSSGSSGNPIVFSAYGAGTSPIISGSLLLTSGWTAYSQNIWEVSTTTQPNIVYFNGTRGVLVTSTTAITTQYDYYWSSNILYVYAPGNVSPSTTYASPGIEAGSLSRVAQTNNQSYITFSNLTFQDANSVLDNAINVGSASVTGIVFSYCIVERGASAGINLKGSTTAHDVTIDHCTFQNNGAYAILVDNQYTTATVSNNNFSGNGWRSVTDALPYSDITSILGNFNIFGNTFYNVAPNGCVTIGDNQNKCHSIYSDASSITMNVYSNIMHGNKDGDGIKTKSSANIYNNMIYGNSGSAIDCGYNGSSNVVLQLYNNLIYGNGSNNNQGGIFENAMGSGTISLSILNNTLYQNNQAEVQVSDNITSLAMKNNILWASSNQRTFYAGGVLYGIVDVDYNLHWSSTSGGAPNIRWGTNYLSWSGWQKTFGFDVHGSNSNPLIVNPTSNFNLQDGSPAIQAGVNVGLITDYAGIPVQNPPSIGAYENLKKMMLVAPQSLRIIGQ